LALLFVSPANLIGIKDSPFGFAILLGEIKKEVAMPIDSMLVSAAVVMMFVVFAGVLAWGQRQSDLTGQQTDNGQRRRRSF
jgi:hypothetical protein